MEKNGFISSRVYQNALALRDLSGALAQYIGTEDQQRCRRSLGLRNVIAQSLATDASLLPTTLEEAYHTNSLNNRLKSASFAHIITKNILAYCNGLENDGVKEKEYLQLLRRELIIFRASFKQWRKSLIQDPR